MSREKYHDRSSREFSKYCFAHVLSIVLDFPKLKEVRSTYTSAAAADKVSPCHTNLCKPTKRSMWVDCGEVRSGGARASSELQQQWI